MMNVKISEIVNAFQSIDVNTAVISAFIVYTLYCFVNLYLIDVVATHCQDNSKKISTLENDNVRLYKKLKRITKRDITPMIDNIVSQTKQKIYAANIVEEIVNKVKHRIMNYQCRKNKRINRSIAQLQKFSGKHKRNIIGLIKDTDYLYATVHRLNTKSENTKQYIFRLFKKINNINRYLFHLQRTFNDKVLRITEQPHTPIATTTAVTATNSNIVVKKRLIRRSVLSTSSNENSPL